MKFFFIFCVSLLPLFGEYENLKNYLKERYTSAFPTLQIEQITLTPKSKQEINASLITQIQLPDANLKRAKGNLLCIYTSDEGKERRVYFGYEIIGTIGILRTTSLIEKDTLLSTTNTTLVNEPFTRLTAIPITAQMLGELYAKRRLQKSAIITTRDAQKPALVQVGDTLSAIAREDGIEVETEVVAKQKGAIGEKIKVKNTQGKTLEATIISKSEVEIR